MRLLEANKIILVAVAGIWTLASSCGQDSKQTSQRSTAPQDGEANPSDDDGATDGDGDDEKAKPKPKPKSSVTLYEKTAYPMLVEWCGSCHSTTQSPLFTNPDVVKAHEAIVTTQKVNFQDVAASRVVLRMTEDNHNCPAIGCEAAGAKLTEQLTKWAAGLEEQKEETEGQQTTDTLQLADATPAVVPSTNPPGVLMIEAESGTFKAPMRMVDVAGASGGKVVDTAAGAGSQNNQATAAASATLGTVVYNFEIKEAGTYRLHGLVNAPTINNNAFWFKVDAGVLTAWQFPANADQYTWDLFDPVVDVGTPFQVALTAGPHTLEIRQRKEQTKVDKIVLSNDPMFNPASAQPAERNVTILTYDIADQTGVAGAKFTVEVSDYSAGAYMFRNPSITMPTGKIKVQNVKLLINDVFLPEHATFTIVDKTVVAPGGSLTGAALVALKDLGPADDKFSFVFEVLEEEN